MSEAAGRLSDLDLRRLWWIVPPLLAGAALRLYGLGRQVISGDELHALRAAISIEFPAILYTYQLTDHCIPLSAFYRLVTLMGVPLRETVLRFPVVLSGLLVLLLIPLWTERNLGRRTAETLAWFLAISPMLVFYSRIVRSYMPIVLLGFAAVAFFMSWCRHQRLRDAIGYAVVGALAIYFHPVAGPFVGAPLVWLVLGQVFRVRDLPSFRSAIGLSLALMAAVATYVIPATRSLSELVQRKHVDSHLSPNTFQGVAILQAGTPNEWLVFGFWFMAALGVVVLLRKKLPLASLGITLIVVQIVGLIILSPLAMEQPGIFNRYVLICLPIILTWVATGIDAAVLGPLDRLGARGKIAATALVPVVPIIFFIAGPLFGPQAMAGSFAHRAGFTTFYKPPKPRPLVDRPEAYEWLSHQREGAVAEYPWHPFWRYMTVYPRHQEDHQRPVVVVIGDRTLWHEDIRLRNMIEPHPGRLLNSRASWLVIHLEISDEEDGNHIIRGSADTPGARDRERRTRMLDRMERLAAKLDRQLTEKWGEADFRTTEHVIWDLDRVRSVSR